MRYKHTIPDNGEFISGEGELIVITTDENREFKTMIEVYAGTEAVAEDKYMQISYTKECCFSRRTSGYFYNGNRILRTVVRKH